MDAFRGTGGLLKSIKLLFKSVRKVWPVWPSPTFLKSSRTLRQRWALAQEPRSRRAHQLGQIIKGGIKGEAPNPYNAISLDEPSRISAFWYGCGGMQLGHASGDNVLGATLITESHAVGYILAHMISYGQIIEGSHKIFKSHWQDTDNRTEGDTCRFEACQSQPGDADSCKQPIRLGDSEQNNFHVWQP